MATQERRHHIDILNCLACFAVVVLHSSGDVFMFSPTPHWYGSMFFQTIAHWAVPVFFMLSGATLLGYRARYSTKEFFKKRAKRILIPFLIWSCIYIVWNAIKGTYPFPSFAAIIGMVLNNDVQTIFWFFYALIPIYLCMPVISLIAKKESVKTLCYWFILCLINVTVLPLLSSFGLEFTSYLQIPIAFSFLNYVLLGWLLDNVHLSTRIRGLIYVGGVVGLLMMFFGTAYLSTKSGTIDARIMEYSSVACVLQATALFVLIKNIDWSFLQRKQLDEKVALLSSASFGVYLTHLIVMDCLIHVLVRISPGTLASAWFILPKALIVYVLSVGIVLAVKRIPVLRRVYP